MPDSNTLKGAAESGSDAPLCSVSSDTPETDAAEWTTTYSGAKAVDSDFARKLERARNHNRICVARLARERDEAREQRDRLYPVRAERDRLATALRSILAFPRDDTAPEIAHFAIRDLAEYALKQSPQNAEAIRSAGDNTPNNQ